MHHDGQIGSGGTTIDGGVLMVAAIAGIEPGLATRSGAVAAGAPVSTEVCLRDRRPSTLGTLFDSEPGGVIGADYQRALALPDHRVLWTFQDAAVRVGPDDIRIVHNIAAIQDGTCFTILYNGSRADPSPFFFPAEPIGSPAGSGRWTRRSARTGVSMCTRPRWRSADPHI